MKVRFKEKYRGDGSIKEFPILLYDIYDNNPVLEFDEVVEIFGMCYNTKLLGFVLADKMEIVNDSEGIEAVDVFIELSKQ